ncbi:hypothetical protein DOTSEDRAFT_35291 [Dothistroma septosporum NZE10]|uniref:Uncharacterized protein n=1 Tax=Dothistroma septosporum (strain NZE10 / CBS 128990) TaxID=675120 RepID=M2Y3Q3_DOTSN|nr:hypothetical protein DOTSEDRAFT_35291 [Dothistroma septosporum NZE10]
MDETTRVSDVREDSPSGQSQAGEFTRYNEPILSELSQDGGSNKDDLGSKNSGRMNRPSVRERRSYDRRRPGLRGGGGSQEDDEDREHDEGDPAANNDQVDNRISAREEPAVASPVAAREAEEPWEDMVYGYGLRRYQDEEDHVGVPMQKSGGKGRGKRKGKGEGNGNGKDRDTKNGYMGCIATDTHTNGHIDQSYPREQSSS